PAPGTEGEMMVEILKYTERIISMIRPRKLLYLAIDGVAPRAKMNQQRSRRFRTAQEAREKDEEAAKQMEEIEAELNIAQGGMVDPELREKKTWDSNCITPGTEFMANLSTCLRYWISEKLNNDPGWAKLKIILSDASVPGEGEHKIMDFVRAQRSSSQYDPNTKHVIYGL
ncbi:4601_t:CDS:2, partial [Paraglomus occultum]